MRSFRVQVSRLENGKEMEKEMEMEKQQKGSVSNLRIFGYALGEGAMSITMNGIANFAMV